MLIHDDIFEWPGFGGKLRLSSGRCRLRIYDLSTGATTAYLRPMVVIVSDVPDSRLSVRSCAGHVATCVSRDFRIPPARMLYVEHTPSSVYGPQGERVMDEKYDAVDFEWTEGGAIRPKWRALQGPVLETVRKLIADSA